MARLIAAVPILYKNTQHAPGDELPTDNPDMIAAWIEGGAAAYKEDEEPAAAKPKARRVTAKAGQTGIAQPSNAPESDLVGQVPEPAARGVVKEPAKRPGKKNPA